MSSAELTPFQLMQKAADFFERFEIPYRIVGSMASMAYCESRFTNDIDILVDLSEQQVDLLAHEFTPPDYYLWLPAIHEAVRTAGQFNIIHMPSGLKIDVIQKKNTPFGLLDMKSGCKIAIPGHYNAWFGSPENIILMKLRYYQEGGSEKHLRDIASMLLVQGASIDRDYINQWAVQLDVGDLWKLVLSKLGGA